MRLTKITTPLDLTNKIVSLREKACKNISEKEVIGIIEAIEDYAKNIIIDTRNQAYEDVLSFLEANNSPRILSTSLQFAIADNKTIQQMISITT